MSGILVSDENITNKSFVLSILISGKTFDNVSLSYLLRTGSYRNHYYTNLLSWLFSKAFRIMS